MRWPFWVKVTSPRWAFQPSVTYQKRLTGKFTGNVRALDTLHLKCSFLWSDKLPGKWILLWHIYCVHMLLEYFSRVGRSLPPVRVNDSVLLEIKHWIGHYARVWPLLRSFYLQALTQTLYWWDHHRERTQNETEKECERSPASLWCVSVRCEGSFTRERTPAVRDTRSHTCQISEDPSYKSKEGQDKSNLWRVSAVGQIQYLIPRVQERGKFHTITKKQLWKTFSSNCQNTMWSYVELIKIKQETLVYRKDSANITHDCFFFKVLKSQPVKAVGVI